MSKMLRRVGFHSTSSFPNCIGPYDMVPNFPGWAAGMSIGALWEDLRKSQNKSQKRQSAASVLEIKVYFSGEKSVGRIYVTSIFSTVFSACSALITFWNSGSARIASQFFFPSSGLE